MDGQGNGRADGSDDRVLIDRVRAGDVAAEHKLYVAHFATAMRSALRGGAQKADAEDFVHEAFIRVLRHLRQGKGPTGPLRPYLHAAVRNAAADAHRGQRARERPSEDWEVLAADRPARLEPQEEIEIRHSVQAAMALLPLRSREMLWRLDVEGHTPARVAADAGIPVQTLSARAYRARKTLRRAVDPDGHMTRRGRVVPRVAG
jgi:RNA polymerase sigma factor (sigma-70 family)